MAKDILSEFPMEHMSSEAIWKDFDTQFIYRRGANRIALGIPLDTLRQILQRGFVISQIILDSDIEAIGPKYIYHTVPGTPAHNFAISLEGTDEENQGALDQLFQDSFKVADDELFRDKWPELFY